MFKGQPPRHGAVAARLDGPRKGTNRVSTNGVTANFMFFDRVLPLTYFYYPKSAGAYLFPQSVKSHYSCGGPVSVDPICPQLRLGASSANRAVQGGSSCHDVGSESHSHLLACGSAD